MLKTILFLLVLIVLTACGGVQNNTPTSESLGTPTSLSNAACSPPSAWTIQYHRTGGIGGFDQSLTLQSDGSLSIQSKHPPLDKQMTIPADHVKPIADLLAQACPFEVSKPAGNCADCFTYELDIQMDGKSYTVQALDTNLSEELRPLTNTLDEFLQLTAQ